MSEEKMKAFIHALFDEFYPDCGDIDGGTLQDLAEKHGILVPEIRHAPCGEFCNCAQVICDEEWQEGIKCFHLANWLAAEHSAHPTLLESAPLEALSTPEHSVTSQADQTPQQRG